MATPLRIDRFGWLRDRAARPLSIAHRGASTYAVDNSLAAFRGAALLGADLWEVDVRTARDGTLVAAHDADVRARDGGGDAVAAHAIADRSYAELASLTDGALSSFDEVLALAAATGSGIYVDAKDRAAAELAPGRLRAHGIERAVIAAFSTPSLRALARRDIGYPLAALVGRGADPFAVAAKSDADIVHLSHSWAAATRPPWRIDDALPASARARGLATVLWHEERPRRVEAMLALPILGMCSNRPELLRRYAPVPASGRPAILCRGGIADIAPAGTLAALRAAVGSGYGVAIEANGTQDHHHGRRDDHRTATLDEALALAREHDADLHIDLTGGDPGGSDTADAVRRTRGADRLDRCTFGFPRNEGARAAHALPGDVRVRVRRGDFETLADALGCRAAGTIEFDADDHDPGEIAACRAVGRATIVDCADTAATTLRRALDSGASSVVLDRPHALRRMIEPDWPDGSDDGAGGRRGTAVPS